VGVGGLNVRAPRACAIAVPLIAADLVCPGMDAGAQEPTARRGPILVTRH